VKRFHLDYTNNPFIIAQNEQMVAINAAIEVDLTGQVCADSLGHNFYSGVGGQVDFIRGAAAASAASRLSRCQAPRAEARSVESSTR
jgi:acyl-CoA hydrolase